MFVCMCVGIAHVYTQRTFREDSKNTLRTLNQSTLSDHSVIIQREHSEKIQRTLTSMAN